MLLVKTPTACGRRRLYGMRSAHAIGEDAPQPVDDADFNGMRSAHVFGETRLQRVHNAMWAFGDRLVRFACMRA